MLLSEDQPFLLASEAPPPPRTSGLTPRPYQEEGIDAARVLIADGVRRILLVLATGGGKCLGLGTPVMRFDGTIVPVETIRTGDLLMGPDSRPRRVLSTTRGHGPLHRITPHRGTPWVCNDVHVLTLTHTVTGEVIDVALPDYLRAHKTFRHVHKQFAPPGGVDFAPADPLPLDPYFFGVWLGDGTKSLVGVAVSKPDPEIAALVEEVAQRHGLHVRTDGNTCPTHHIVGVRGQGNPLLNLLRAVAGDASEIPHAYLTASRADRAALLAGILDTDGYLHNGGYDVVQLRRSYADGIAFVARSLGLRALVSPKKVNGTTYWRISIAGDCSTLPTRIARKAAPPRRQVKCATRTGFNVDAIGEGEYAGFELDGDGRFLLGDFTVTHNTIIAALVALGAVAKGKRVLFIGPRREIIAQAFWKLVEAGIAVRDCGVVMADGIIPHVHTREPYNARRPNAPVQVASIQTLANRKLPPADVVFIDEAHHATSATWSKIITHYTELGAVVVGLTATPCRADGAGLGKLFDRLHVIASFADLAAQGFLVIPRVFTTPCAPDLSKVRITAAGEYDQEQLAKTMRTTALVGDVVEHWQKHAAGRTTVVFAASVEHSRDLCAAFRAAGIAADHVDATTHPDERDAALTRLARGEITVLCNMGICTEGWDLPRCKCVVLARPTKSLSLFLQMVGRGLRPYEETTAIILDHASAVHEHGFPSDDRDWSLDGRVKRKKAVAVRTCEGCYAALPGGTMVCPECGYAFPVEEREIPESVDGELVEAVAKPKPTMDERVAFYADALKRGATRGRKLGWCRHRFKEHFGGWPRGPRLVALEREHYPAIVDPPVDEPSLAEVEPEVARLAPPVRARRLDLSDLLFNPEPAAAAAIEAWTL